LKLHPDGVTMVATDGHRLALAERKHHLPDLKQEVAVLVPRKALLSVRKLADEHEEGTHNRDLTRRFTRILRAWVTPSHCAAAHWQFPNYESVLPKKNGKVAELNREALEAVVQRVSLLADDRLHGIRLALAKNRLEVSASSTEYGEAREVVELGTGTKAWRSASTRNICLKFSRR